MNSVFVVNHGKASLNAFMGTIFVFILFVALLNSYFLSTSVRYLVFTYREFVQPHYVKRPFGLAMPLRESAIMCRTLSGYRRSRCCVVGLVFRILFGPLFLTILLCAANTQDWRVFVN